MIHTTRKVTLDLTCDICSLGGLVSDSDSETNCENIAKDAGWAFIGGSSPKAICPSCFQIYLDVKDLIHDIAPIFKVGIERKIHECNYEDC